MSPVRKTALRRSRDREKAVAFLKAIGDGSGDLYECYRELYMLWYSNNMALPELKPLFSITGIDPNGCFSVNESFRTQVRTLVATILPLIAESGETSN